MFTKAFWKDATERAVKTAAQFALVFIGADGAQIAHLNWTIAAAYIGGGFVASIFTSIISGATPPGQIGPTSNSPEAPAFTSKK